MTTLTKNDLQAGKGFASFDLREDLLKIDSDIFINFSYTDYGGDFFDRVACEYFELNYKDSFLSENTSYYGKNGYLFGEVAKKFIEDSDNYLLGFENIEDFYFEKQNGSELESFQFFLDDLKNDFEVKETALDFLMENKSGYYSVQSSGSVDFCYSDLEAYLLENNQITKIED